MALEKKIKDEIIKKFAQAKLDTGSPEIQVALLTEEINMLKTHLDEHGHDATAKRGLLAKIAKRRRLVRYLSLHNPDRHKKLIKSVGLSK